MFLMKYYNCLVSPSMFHIDIDVDASNNLNLYFVKLIEEKNAFFYKIMYYESYDKFDW